MSSRVASIQVGCPLLITVSATKMCTNPGVMEKRWHRAFRDRRVRGEWFLLSAQDKRNFHRWVNEQLDEIDDISVLMVLTGHRQREDGTWVLIKRRVPLAKRRSKHSVFT